MKQKILLGMWVGMNVMSNVCYSMQLQEGAGHKPVPGAASPKVGAALPVKPALQKSSSVKNEHVAPQPPAGSPPVLSASQPASAGKAVITIAHVSAQDAGEQEPKSISAAAAPEVKDQEHDHDFEEVVSCKRLAKDKNASELARVRQEIVDARAWGHTLAHRGRSNMVTAALDSKESGEAEKYFRSIDGGSAAAKLILHTLADIQLEKLNAESETLSFVARVLEEGSRHGLKGGVTQKTAHTIWKTIKLMKTSVIDSADDDLMREVEQFTNAIASKFAERARLVEKLADMQHRAHTLAKEVKEDPRNESDSDDHESGKKPKGWDRKDVFAEFGINAPVICNGIACAISLADLAQASAAESK